MRRRVERQLADSIEADEEEEGLPALMEQPLSQLIPEPIAAGAPAAALATGLPGPKGLPRIRPGAASRVKQKPPEMSWPDYLIMLLHTGAEIEHCLMVQYLYAAYSLGGDKVPQQYQTMVRRWRESILTTSAPTFRSCPRPHR